MLLTVPDSSSFTVAQLIYYVGELNTILGETLFT